MFAIEKDHKRAACVACAYALNAYIFSLQSGALSARGAALLGWMMKRVFF